jgi:hypothetical protein
MAGAAVVTLERLADHGWRSVVGEPAAHAGRRLVPATVIDRGDAFDPFASRLSGGFTAVSRRP